MPVHRLPRPSGPVADGERLAAYSCGGSRGIGASSSPHSLLIPEGNRRDHDRAVFLSVQPGSRPLPDIAQAAKLFGNRSVAVEPGDGNCGGMGRQTLISAQPELRRTVNPAAVFARCGDVYRCFSRISHYIAPQRVRVPGPRPGLLLEGLPQRVFRRGRTDDALAREA